MSGRMMVFIDFAQSIARVRSKDYAKGVPRVTSPNAEYAGGEGAR